MSKSKAKKISAKQLVRAPEQAQRVDVGPGADATMAEPAVTAPAADRGLIEAAAPAVARWKRRSP